jgi:hypothetical protein
MAAGVALIFAGLGTFALAAPGEAAPSEAPVGAAATGLAITPANGSTEQQVIGLTIPASCPTGSTHFLVEIVGGGFPSGSNVVGYSTLGDDKAAKTFTTPGTWQVMAGSQSATTPLSGTATMTFKCVDDNSGDIKGTFTGSVTFTPTTGGNSSFTSSGGGAAPTPGATSTPTPTTSTTPAPTPEPTEEPAPTPEPTDDPAEECTADDCTDTTSDDAGSGALPGTGGSDPTPLVSLAFLLVGTGVVVVLFGAAYELASRGDLR